MVVCKLINVVCPENVKGICASNFARKHLAPVQGKQVAASQDRIDPYEFPETLTVPKASAASQMDAVIRDIARKLHPYHLRTSSFHHFRRGSQKGKKNDHMGRGANHQCISGGWGGEE